MVLFAGARGVVPPHRVTCLISAGWSFPADGARAPFRLASHFANAELHFREFPLQRSDSHLAHSARSYVSILQDQGVPFIVEVGVTVKDSAFAHGVNWFVVLDQNARRAGYLDRTSGALRESLRPSTGARVLLLSVVFWRHSRLDVISCLKGMLMSHAHRVVPVLRGTDQGLEFFVAGQVGRLSSPSDRSPCGQSLNPPCRCHARRASHLNCLGGFRPRRSCSCDAFAPTQGSFIGWLRAVLLFQSRRPGGTPAGFNLFWWSVLVSRSFRVCSICPARRPHRLSKNFK